MNDRLTIELSNCDKIGNYRVTTTCGRQRYLGTFNPAADWQRQDYAKNVILQFGWEPTAEHLEEIAAAVQDELLRTERAREEKLEVVRVSELKSTPVSWLWPGRIAHGTL